MDVCERGPLKGGLFSENFLDLIFQAAVSSFFFFLGFWAWIDPSHFDKIKWNRQVDNIVTRVTMHWWDSLTSSLVLSFIASLHFHEGCPVPKEYAVLGTCAKHASSGV